MRFTEVRQMRGGWESQLSFNRLGRIDISVGFKGILLRTVLRVFKVVQNSLAVAFVNSSNPKGSL